MVSQETAQPVIFPNSLFFQFERKFIHVQFITSSEFCPFHIQFMLKRKKTESGTDTKALTSEQICCICCNSQGTVRANQSLKPTYSDSGLSLEFNTILSPFLPKCASHILMLHTRRFSSTHTLPRVHVFEYTAPTTLSAFPTLPKREFPFVLQSI